MSEKAALDARYTQVNSDLVLERAKAAAAEKERDLASNLLLHYERKLDVLVDTADNRRLIDKSVEVFQYPDGRIEIRVAGRALPYSLYINSRTIEQGAIPRIEALLAQHRHGGRAPGQMSHLEYN
jgi:hypothetical protein